MKTIKTKEILKNFKGLDLKNDSNESITVGEALSNILLSDKVGGKLKCVSLAQRLYNDALLEVDDSDFKLIKESVERNEIYNNLVSGQLLSILEDIK